MRRAGPAAGSCLMLPSMSDAEVSIHVRGVARRAVLAEVERRMARRGFEPVRGSSDHESLLVRVRLTARGPWVSLAIEGLESPDDWARALARGLGAPALGSWFWEDEASLELRLFVGGARAAKLSLPRDARRAADGRVAIPLGGLSQLVPRSGAKTARADLEILVRDEEAAFDEDDRCEHLSDGGQEAICRAFGLERLFVDPLDEDAIEEILAFRPKPTSAISKRARAEQDAAALARRADHDGRIYAVGWLAFDAGPRDVARLIDRTARVIVGAITPHLGSRTLLARAVVPTKGETPLPAPSEGARAWKGYAGALREGVLVDLGHREPPPLGAVWMVLRDGALEVGWSMRGLRDPDKRRAFGAAMSAVLTASADDVRCFGGLVACQRVPMSVAQQALAYEYLRGTSALAIRPDSHRARARAPGWRVLVPRTAPPLAPGLPSGVEARSAKAGVVLDARAPDPHTTTPAAMDELEAYLTRSGALAVR